MLQVVRNLKCGGGFVVISPHWTLPDSEPLFASYVDFLKSQWHNTRGTYPNPKCDVYIFPYSKSTILTSKDMTVNLLVVGIDINSIGMILRK